MPEQKMFKTAVFGGFEKEDVLKYIDAKTMEFTAYEAQLNDEVNAAAGKLTEKEDELRELNDSCEELRRGYLELQGQLQAAAAQIKSLQSELSAVRGYNEEQEKEMAILKEQNRLLADEVEQKNTKNEKLRSVAGEWSAAMDGVGESARLMVSGAGTNAKSIIAQAEQSAADVNGELENFRAEVAKIKSFAEDSMAVLVQRLDYIDKAAGEAKLGTEKRASQRGDIEKRSAEIAAGINEKISSFKKIFFQ